MKNKTVLRGLLTFFTNINGTLNNFLNNGSKLSLANNSKELKNHLERLDVDINNLNCICCRKNIDDLSHLRGIYKHKGEIISYCDKPLCQLEASNRQLS